MARAVASSNDACDLEPGLLLKLPHRHQRVGSEDSRMSLDVRDEPEPQKEQLVMEEADVVPLGAV